MRREWLPPLFDWVVAVALTALMVGGSIGESNPTIHASSSEIHWIKSHPPGAAYSLVVLAGVALVLRRRRPLHVLAVSVVAVSAYSAAGYVPGAALCGVYVALFTVATLTTRAVAVWSGAASMLLLFVTAGVGGALGWVGGTNTIMLACSIAAVAIGLAVAGRRQVFAATIERAERAERDREGETRRRVDAERLRIARELHDVVAHSMSMINVQAGVAAHVIDTQPEQAAAALTAIKEASREGLRELRAILNVLRQVDEPADGGDRGPAPRLSQLDALAEATTQAGLPTSLSVSGDTAGLPATLELAVYRIVQESLTNVMRHAGPDAHASVQVSVGRRAVSVQVEDDGAGLAGVEHRGGGGTGIAGMRERTAAFGGTLEAGPRASGGWRVAAVLTLPDDADVPAGVTPQGSGR